MSTGDESGLNLPFSSKMGMLVKSQCHTILPDESIVHAAQKMNQEAVDALVIMDNGSPQGIVTQTDLVFRGLAQEKPQSEPVSSVMSSDIITIQKDQPIFDGLMLMVNHGVRHLVVMDTDILAGVVSEHDWMTFQRRHPVIVINSIINAESFAEIGRLRSIASQMARKIFEKEGNAVSVARLFSEINDRVTTRVIELALRWMHVEERGDPPTSFAWIGMGSEGRKAQTTTTDQDNGIIFDNVPAGDLQEVKNWFLELAEKVVTGLEVCGFSRCQGNIMATNPELCQSLDGWKKLFSDIISVVDPFRLLKASIYFDFRHLFGRSELTDSLKKFLNDHISTNQSFLRHMAGNMMAASRPPVDAFRWKLRSLLGMSPPPFDIKRQALSPLVDAARILALKCGSSRTNTLERLDDALEKGTMNKQALEAAGDAYDFIMLLRVRHDFSTDAPHANRFNPKHLNPLQREFLKDALRSISQLQSGVFFLIGGIDL
jgi:CBS domain-containing protein